MESILKLKRLLSLSEKLEAESYFDYFKRIAEILMNNCVISKGENCYEIVEIEFYLFTLDHQDVITYPRKLSAGQWFFHPSGVDITFETFDNHFGGILIRGLKRLTPREDGNKRPLYIFGPQKCVDELWDNFNAFEQNSFEYPIIIQKTISSDDNIIDYPRWIPLDKKIIDKVGESEAKRMRIEATIERNRKYIIDNPYLSLDGIYDNIDRDLAISTMFDSRYRFYKCASIDCNSIGWKNYTSKPK